MFCFPSKGVCMFCLLREGLRGISPFVLYINKTSFSPLTYNYVVVQFYPWFNFYFVLFLGMVMYDNEFETKEKNI